MYVYIALGSNIGDKHKNIENALVMIDLLIGDIVEVSSKITTKPYGYKEQDDFVNAVCKVSSNIKPSLLLSRLKEIEELMGRYKTFRWGPRLIDLDIIFYDNYIIESDDLNIPHIDYHNRLFVILPLLEIEPDIFDPKRKKYVKDILEELKKNKTL